MKTKLFLILVLLGFAFHLDAQEVKRYYNETRTFVEDGYTYQCDVPPSSMVTLYNKENKFTYEDSRYKDTGIVYVPKEDGKRYVSVLADAATDRHTRPLCFEIVNKAFTPEQAARTKGNSLGVSIYINPETGKIDEVNFTFIRYSPFATIPVSVYRQIEVELKEKLHFNISEEGRLLNFIFLWWRQKVGETAGK